MSLQEKLARSYDRKPKEGDVVLVLEHGQGAKTEYRPCFGWTGVVSFPSDDSEEPQVICQRCDRSVIPVLDKAVIRDWSNNSES